MALERRSHVDSHGLSLAIGRSGERYFFMCEQSREALDLKIEEYRRTYQNFTLLLEPHHNVYSHYLEGMRKKLKELEDLSA